MIEGNGIIDTRIGRYDRLRSPEEMRKFIPRSELARQTVLMGRRGIEDILDHKDNRIFVNLGECSTHDSEATYELARHISEVAARVSDLILIVNRKHFEKPRASPSWEGLIVDPHMDGSEDMVEGLYWARIILMKTLELGLPCSTEYVDTFVPQYTSDLVSWAAIGARTSYSQMHRKLASGLSMPVGIKNDTHGDVSVAVNAVLYARERHSFLGIDEEGMAAIVKTKGNPYAHVVLRGGDSGPNYDEGSVRQAQSLLERHELMPNLVIDCSHGNSGKDHTKQPEVFEEVIRQIRGGNRGIVGVMFECNLYEGRQKIPANLHCFDKGTLKYGVSVTDGGVDKDTAIKMIEDGYRTLKRSSVSLSGTGS